MTYTIEDLSDLPWSFIRAEPSLTYVGTERMAPSSYRYTLLRYRREREERKKTVTIWPMAGGFFTHEYCAALIWVQP